MSAIVPPPLAFFGMRELVIIGVVVALLLFVVPALARAVERRRDER